MKKNLFKQTIISSLLFVITFSIIIRFLSLINRIILNRMLGIDGISLYTIIIPSIMLFISLGSISLNTSINQIASSNKNHYDKSLFKDSLILALIFSSISSLILLTIISHLTKNWLKTEEAFFPIISSIPLIYLTSISSVLRGTYNGLSKIKLTYISIFIEQIFRIASQILLLIISSSLIKSVTFVILAMSIGEIASIIFLLIKIKKIPTIKSNTSYTKQLLKLSIPTSLTHLISSMTLFLEPIIITFIFTKLNYSKEIIRTSYSEITAYIIPTITIFLFISSSVSPILIQKTSYYNTINDNKSLQKICTKILYYVSLSSVILIFILYFYGNDIIKLLYNYNLNTNILKKYVFLFIFIYLESPIIAIMQGLKENKSLFIKVTIASIIKLIILLILPFISSLEPKEIIFLSYIIYYSFITITSYIKIRKKIELKLPFKLIISFLVFTVFIYYLFSFINLLFLI